MWPRAGRSSSDGRYEHHSRSFDSSGRTSSTYDSRRSLDRQRVSLDSEFRVASGLSVLWERERVRALGTVQTAQHACAGARSCRPSTAPPMYLPFSAT